MSNIAIMTAGVVAATGLITAPASAKTVSEFWQVSVQMPPQLWDDAAALPNIPGMADDVFQRGATTYRIRWTNAAIRQIPKYMLGQQGGRTGATTAGLYDRALRAQQMRKYKLKQRLLWLDADILIADSASPACTGVTRPQLDGILTGAITDWRQVFPAWPQNLDSRVVLRVAGSSNGEFRHHFGRNTYPSATQRSTDGGTLGVSGGAVGVQKLSYAARYLATAGLCAVPVDGIAPSEQTTRERSYPGAYGVYYVSRKKPTKGIGAKSAPLIKRWEELLFGAPGDTYLTTSLGRQRYLP